MINILDSQSLSLTKAFFYYLFSFLILDDFKREIDVELLSQLMANLMFFQCCSKSKLKRHFLIADPRQFKAIKACVVGTRSAH